MMLAMESMVLRGAEVQNGGGSSPAISAFGGQPKPLRTLTGLLHHGLSKSTERELKTMTLAAALIALAGCSMTLPVRGQVGQAGETFAGTATGYMDGAGDLTVTTSKATTCTGAFVYETARRGAGTFTCSDGRTGPFEFVSTGSRGTGTGRLNGEVVTFTFGP